MSGYANLEKRIADREVILLDGAVGTQLQSMGVPMNHHAWAAMALKDHPYTVRRMHELYIEAGVDIVTVNTYASARHNLEPLGLADLTTELNLRAVVLAQEARDRRAKDRPVAIAGSVSNFGLLAGCEPGWLARYPSVVRSRSVISDEQAKANLREQAEILAEAGVDFILAEPTGGTTHRKWVVEACASVGLPLWAGFKCHQEEGDPTPRVGYTSEEPLDQAFDEVTALGGSVVTIFHSAIAATEAALPVVQSHWKGPIAVYPEAERQDYVAAYRDSKTPTSVSPADFAGFARDCVGRGVQIVGGCCGIELDHIRGLREQLPTHLPR